MNETTGGHDLGASAPFGAAVLLGGGNFLAVRFSNSELPPFWGAGLRFSIAGLLFLAGCVWWRLPWPRGRRLIETVVYGFLNFALFYALMYWALVRVTAGMVTVVLAMVPLITVILAAGQRLERLSRRAIVGSLLALVGIVGMTVSPGGFEAPVSGLLAMICAACCVGQSVILGKRISGNYPAMTNAVALLTGAPVLLVISSLTGEQWALPRAPEAIWAVAYLVTLGSVGLFVLVILVVRRWSASSTAYMFCVVPVGDDVVRGVARRCAAHPSGDDRCGDGDRRSLVRSVGTGTSAFEWDTEGSPGGCTQSVMGDMLRPRHRRSTPCGLMT